MLSIHFTSRSTTRFFILSRCSSFFAFCAIHCCTRASGAVSSASERFGIAAFAGGLRNSYGDASGVRGDATGARDEETVFSGGAFFVVAAGRLALLAVVVFTTAVLVSVLVARNTPASSFPGPNPTPEPRRPASRASFFMLAIVRRISDSAFEHWSRCFKQRWSAAQDIAEDASPRACAESTSTASRTSRALGLAFARTGMRSAREGGATGGVFASAEA
mmetsp:Transcript_3080/g.12329  ORF Transcript_3080/g.12329 Transcript_3080/m.12329 type:complete len:219 (-) Transcript_3080:43-699(-)